MIVLYWLEKNLFAPKPVATGKLLQLTSKQTGIVLPQPKFKKLTWRLHKHANSCSQ